MKSSTVCKSVFFSALYFLKNLNTNTQQVIAADNTVAFLMISIILTVFTAVFITLNALVISFIISPFC